MPKTKTPEEIEARKKHRREIVRRWRERHPDRQREQARRWQVKNPGKVRANALRWRAANATKMREQARRWRAANRERELATRRRTQYGLAVGQYERMLAEQGNRCAICNVVFASRRDTHIDHCHSTGQVRALLCGHCNRGLGLFKEDTVRLQRAVDYLIRFKPE